ncbi:hypothetical protein D3C84_1067930 [compost metagenome]
MQPHFLGGLAGMGAQLLDQRHILRHVVIEEVLGDAAAQGLGIGKILIQCGADLCCDYGSGAAAHGFLE